MFSIACVRPQPCSCSILFQKFAEALGFASISSVQRFLLIFNLPLFASWQRLPNWTAQLSQSIVGFLRLPKDRPRAFKGVGRGLILTFDATVWGHVHIVDFCQRGRCERAQACSKRRDLQ